MSRTEDKPRLTTPVQTPPVYRDDGPASAIRGGDGGIDAAASGCANLPGAARQLCYAMRTRKV
ncbi:hypothetical protein [Streptomyces sp. TE33382]